MVCAYATTTHPIIAGTNPIHNKKPKKEKKEDDDEDKAHKAKLAAGTTIIKYDKHWSPRLTHGQTRRPVRKRQRRLQARVRWVEVESRRAARNKWLKCTREDIGG